MVRKPGITQLVLQNDGGGKELRLQVARGDPLRFVSSRENRERAQHADFGQVLVERGKLSLTLG